MFCDHLRMGAARTDEEGDAKGTRFFRPVIRIFCLSFAL